MFSGQPEAKNPDEGGAVSPPKDASGGNAGKDPSSRTPDDLDDQKLTVEHWIGVLRGPEPGRSRAVAALVKRKGKAVSALAKVVKEGNPEVATAAIRALGQIGPEASEAVPVLVLSLNSPVLRGPAAEALGSIGPRASDAVLPIVVILESKPTDDEPLLKALDRINPGAGKCCRRLKAIDQEQRLLASEQQLEEARLRTAQTTGDITGVKRAADRLAELAAKRVPLAEEAEQLLRQLGAGRGQETGP